MIIILIQLQIIQEYLIDFIQDLKIMIIQVEISTGQEIKIDTKEEGKLNLIINNVYKGRGQMIINTIMVKINIIGDREEAFLHLKKEVLIKVTMIYNKKDHILINLISMILTSTNLNFKISFLIKEEIYLLKLFNHSNQETKINKTDFLVTEIMLRNI